jgi:hypothetical protein
VRLISVVFFNELRGIFARWEKSPNITRSEFIWFFQLLTARRDTPGRARLPSLKIG